MKTIYSNSTPAYEVGGRYNNMTPDKPGMLRCKRKNNDWIAVMRCMEFRSNDRCVGCPELSRTWSSTNKNGVKEQNQEEKTEKRKKRKKST